MKATEVLVVVGEELMLGWKSLALLAYVPPGPGIMVRLTGEPSLVSASPLPEESP